MTARAKKREVIPAEGPPPEFRSNEDAGPAAAVVKFLEERGAAGLSAAAEYAEVIRRLEWEHRQVGSGPNLLEEIAGLERRREDLERRAAPCPTCRRPGADADVEGLREVKLKIVKLRGEHEARLVRLGSLRERRHAAQKKLYIAANDAAERFILSLGIPGKLRPGRGRYIVLPEEIPEAIVAACRLVEQLGEMTQRLVPLVSDPAGFVTLSAELDDDELEVALGARLGFSRSVMARGFVRAGRVSGAAAH